MIDYAVSELTKRGDPKINIKSYTVVQNSYYKKIVLKFQETLVGHGADVPLFQSYYENEQQYGDMMESLGTYLWMTGKLALLMSLSQFVFHQICLESYGEAEAEE